MNPRKVLVIWAVLLGCCRAALAAPLIPPEEILTEDQLRPGMKGIAKSVFHGTQVESFPITVLGVLEKIDFGANIILIRVDGGPPVTSGAGLSGGMSGSPVYVNGRLIGAISLSWPFAKQPIAGVTPIRQMMEAVEPGSAPKAVPASGTLRPRHEPLVLPQGRFTRVVVGPQAQPGPGTLALRPLATPVSVSGMNSEARRYLERVFEPYGLVPVSGPGTMSNPPPAPAIEPGSAIGAQLVSGDIDITAVGTVTWAKDGKVLAFGHPLLAAGLVDVPLTAAYVHGVVPSLEFSSKVASPLQIIGRFTQDRPWCVSGKLGETARMVPIGLKIADLDRKIERTYGTRVIDQRGLTQALAFAIALSAVASMSPPMEGTTTATLVVKADGLPEIRRATAFAGGERESLMETIFGGSPFGFLPLGEVMEVLDGLENNPFGRARLTAVDLDIGVTAERRSASIEAASSSKQRAKPGDELDITAEIQPYEGKKTTRTVRVRIPEDVPSGRVQIGVSGGRSLMAGESRLGIERPEPKSLEQLARQLSRPEAATDVVVDVVPPSTGVEVAGYRLPNVPYHFAEVLDTAPGAGRRLTQDYKRTTVATPFVLSGNAVLNIIVEADEKEKAGPRRAPEAMFPGMEEMSEFFGGLFRFAGMSARGFSAQAARHKQQALATPAPEEEEEESPEVPSMDELEEISKMEPEELRPPGEEAAPGKPAGKSIARAAAVWKQASAKDFAAGKTDGTAVRSDGRVVLAPSVTTVFDSSDKVPWALAVSGDRLFVAAWPGANVYQASAQSGQAAQQPLTAMSVEAAGITALASGPDGKVYAAVAPDAAIYAFDPSQASAQPSLVCRLDDDYVWALAFHGSDLYAATGPHAAVYRIDLEHKAAKQIFRAPDRHAIAMAIDAQGRIYLGTYPKGKLYRISQDGKAEPLYEVPDQTIQALALGADGSVYLGTSPKGQVWRLGADGQAKMLLDAEERHIMALVPVPGGVLAGAGARKATIYRVEDDGTSSVLYRPMSSYVLAMAPDGAGGLFAALAGSGQLVHVQFSRDQGTFTSAVHDAGTTADWGRISWQANIPQGCALTFQTRSGNTTWPDETWSTWSPEYASATGEKIGSPPSRYVQYRCVEKGAGQAAPSLERVQVWYMGRNRPPEVTVSSPASGDVVSRRARVRWRSKDPDKDALTYQVFYSGDSGKTWNEIATQIGQAAAETEKKPAAAAPKSGKAQPPKRPNPPAAQRKKQPTGEQEAEEQPVETEETPESEGASRTWADWDTRRVKDGTYVVKVSASDKQSNPGQGLSAEDVSDTFIVDNTAPVLTLERAGGIVSKVICRDAATYIASAEYRIDGGRWTALASEDGVFDSSQEILVIDPAAMPAGRHRLEFRARDAANNEGTAAATYTKTAPK
jgi:hypothetical protein